MVSLVVEAAISGRSVNQAARMVRGLDASLVLLVIEGAGGQWRI